MMLARVADSLYWIGRYIERAEHMSRLADVMLTASLDQTESAVEAARIALAAVGDADDTAASANPFEAAQNRGDVGAAKSPLSAGHILRR